MVRGSVGAWCLNNILVDPSQFYIPYLGFPLAMSLSCNNCTTTYFLSLAFHFVDCFLCCAADFGFDVVPLVDFCFFVFAFDVKSKKSLPRQMSRILLPLFSSRSFMVSGLMFKSLIHFELILVKAVRYWSNFILLHVAVQLPNTIY